jgi:hypothetical protein
MEIKTKNYHALKFVIHFAMETNPITFYTPKTSDETKLAEIEQEFYDAWENEDFFTTQTEDNDLIGWMRINTKDIVCAATFVETFIF